MNPLRFCLIAGLGILLTVSASAAPETEQDLTLRDHAFVPAELTVPAGQKIKLTVHNEDATPAEFESDDLDREKVVPPKGETVIYVGPLDAGTYDFFDDFHHSTTTGKLIAR